MTQSVVEKSSIPEKTWRRQTNSPTWWIAFSCGSVILHLLAFWLISSYKLSASQSGSASAIPIEFIEISPQKSPQAKPEPKPKAVLPKPSAKPIVPQNSQPAVNPSAVKPPVITNDRDAIAFDNQKIEQKLAEQQRQQELLQQQQLADQQRQLTEELRQRQAQQEKVEAQLRQREQEQQQKLEQKQQQLEAQQLEQEAQQRKEAEQQRLREAQQEEFVAEQQRLREPQSRREADEQQNLRDGEEITAPIVDKFGQIAKQASVNQQTPNSPVKDNRNEQIPLNQNQETQLNQNSGILTASWNIDNSFTPKKDIPDNLPRLKQNISQNFIIPPSPNSNFEPVDIEVYLIINEEGYVEFAQVGDIEMRRQYQTYVDQNLLNKQLFLPATDIDPRTGEVKPRRGELRIRIKIQQAS